MFMSLISHLVSAWFAFLLPCYGTWKALSHRPISEPDLERWAMYWSVVGAFVAVEYVAEWFISWFPFYWEAKTLFLLFLALPQTQGSTWIYNTYLQPLFVKNEADIDAGIVAAQTNLITFLQSRLSMLWDTIHGIITKSQAASTQQPAENAPAAQQPANNPLSLAKGFWDAYGPSVMGALQRTTPSAQENVQTRAPYDVPAASSSSVSFQPDAASQKSIRVSPPPSSHSSGPPVFPEPQVY